MGRQWSILSLCFRTLQTGEQPERAAVVGSDEEPRQGKRFASRHGHYLLRRPTNQAVAARPRRKWRTSMTIPIMSRM
jgi:hypothetical protein